MRHDGDILIEHLAAARSRVLLCAPFIKTRVLQALLSRIGPSVSLHVVTRWLPEEVAAGVSDLEVLDIVAARAGASLALLDRLHAKLYVADNGVLAGSANLTATALGWCSRPNLEILTTLSISDVAVARCLEELNAARPATEAERQRVRALADKLPVARMPAAQEVDGNSVGPWLPRLAAPQRLFAAYLQSARDRLTVEALAAADHDLQALDLPASLGEVAFKRAVASRFAAMPNVARILVAAASDLTDADGVALIREIHPDSDQPAESNWQVVREWMTYFLSDTYEIAPQSFITRRRPGAGR
jgi:hypothetical protein